MHMTRTDNNRLSEEEVYRQFNNTFDHHTYCLELEYDERLGSAITEATRTRLDEKQARFDQMMAAHPATIAEQARRTEIRQLEVDRLGRIAARKEVREKEEMQSGIERIARKWRAKLVQK